MRSLPLRACVATPTEKGCITSLKRSPLHSSVSCDAARVVRPKAASSSPAHIHTGRGGVHV